MLNDLYLDALKKIVLSHVKNNETSVFLFGSRAKSDRRSRSDVDIGFMSPEKIDSMLFAAIRDEAEESVYYSPRFSFWMRRNHEGNIDEVHAILKEILEIYR